MAILKKILKELKVIARTASYFAIVFIMMMIMKKLYLKDYDIEFTGISQALIGALVLSKVVLLMEMISLGKWVQSKPPIVDIILRTLMYTAGVLFITILEKLFERRHEPGGLGDSIKYLFSHRDIYHVWATTIGAAGAIFIYNAFSIIQRLLGQKAFVNLYFNTRLDQIEHATLSENKLSFQKG